MGRLRLPLGSSGEITVKSVGKRFSARCWYRHNDGTYVDVRRRGSSKDKARQAVRDAIADLVTHVPGSNLSANSTFDNAAKQWLEQYEADAEAGVYSFTSVDTYRDHLRNHVLPTLGQLRLGEITTPIINRLCQANLRGYSLSLARHTKAVIGNVLTFAVQAGAIKTNPTKEIAPLTAKKAKTKKSKVKSLTATEVMDFLGKLDADEEARTRDLPDLVRFFVATGERRGEALGAHWSDFDADAGILAMTGNVVQARGRGTIRNEGKSDNADRSIPLPAWCVQMLKERRANLATVDPGKPIFPNSVGGYLNAANLTNRHWVPFRKRAGYEWVTFHTFRKTVATLLDDAGLTARQIADVLGHAHPSMTLDNYMGRAQVSRASADALDSAVRS